MPTPKADWSEKNIARVTKLWLEGNSASTIAKIMGAGFTSNSVIGKVHRLKLVRSADTPKPDTRPKKSRYKASKTAPPPPDPEVRVITVTADPLTRSKAPPKEDVEEEVYVAPQVQELYIPEDQRITTVLHLNEHTCKWPIGNPGEPDFHFCGQHSEDNYPYCEFHCRRAYHQTDKKKR